MSIGKCQLCLQSKPLIKAHILTRHLYGTLVKSGELCPLQISRRNDGRYDTKKEGSSNGWVDPDILCENCDGVILNSYEKYADQLFKHGVSQLGSLRQSDEISYYDVQNVDYQKFKLFFLSQLWRAHVSKLSVFENVKLKNYAENLRLMLLNGDPGDETDFPFWIFWNSQGIDYRGRAIDLDIITPFSVCRAGGHSQSWCSKIYTYHVFVNGLGLNYFIGRSNKVKDPKILEYSLRSNGNIRIVSCANDLVSTVINRSLAGLPLLQK